MKLWMVIYIAGRVYAVWADPMPNDMTLADCQIKASRWTDRTARTLDPVDQPEYACVRRWLRPHQGDLPAILRAKPQRPAP